MYHDIYRDTPSESGLQTPMSIKYKVSAMSFEDQIAAISEYLQKHKLPKETVDFTFDDGGVSFLTVAAPILEKYGFRGKFYISTGFIGVEGFLNTEQIRELHERGHVVGSHSHSHPRIMTSLSEADIVNEWLISQMLLTEVLGFTPQYASIPNGYSSKFILKAMTDVGICYIDNSAPTTDKSRLGDAIIRGRYAITCDMNTNMVMTILTSPLYRTIKSLRWKTLSIAKAILGHNYLTLRTGIVKHLKHGRS